MYGSRQGDSAQGADDDGDGDMAHRGNASAVGAGGGGVAAPASPYHHHPYRPVDHIPVHKDAFATILQWLHSRIPYAHGHVTVPGKVELDPSIKPPRRTNLHGGGPRREGVRKQDPAAQRKHSIVDWMVG